MKRYTVYEVSKAFDVGPETVRRWIRDGKLVTTIACKRLGHVIDEVELENFIDRHPKYRAYMPIHIGQPDTISEYKRLKEQLIRERNELLRHREIIDERIHEIEKLLKEG